MLDIARGRNIYRNLMLADLTKPTDIPTAEYDAAICAGLFTYGHLDAECLDEIFRTIKSGGFFAGAIRQQIWEEMGFHEKFTAWEKDQRIKTLSSESMDNYENANKNDGLYIVVQKL